jgi:hypothetical protein
MALTEVTTKSCAFQALSQLLLDWPHPSHASMCLRVWFVPHGHIVVMKICPSDKGLNLSKRSATGMGLDLDESFEVRWDDGTLIAVMLRNVFSKEDARASFKLSLRFLGQDLFTRFDSKRLAVALSPCNLLCSPI